MIRNITCLLAGALSAWGCGGKEAPKLDTKSGTETKTAIPAGQLHFSLSPAGTPAETYAAYVPAGKPGPLPVVIFFDPQGEGWEPVKLYKKLADERGYMLLGSNASRNGMQLTETDAIAKRLLAEARSLPGADTAHIYFCGFSGGAKVAANAGMNNPQVAGVIACGATPDKIRATGGRLHYYALVGNEDFNYPEMQIADSALQRTQWKTYLKNFEGKHAWPHESDMSAALLWHELRDLEARGLPASQKLLEEAHAGVPLFSGGIANSTGKGLFRDFALVCQQENLLHGVFDTQNLVAQKEGLLASPILKKYRADRKRALEEEVTDRDLYPPRMQAEGVEWWQKEIDRLNQCANDQNELTAARCKRLKSYISMLCYVYLDAAIRQNQPGEANRVAGIYALADPENPDRFYMQAQMMMRYQKPEMALGVLGSAVQKGFTDKTKLEADPLFASLRTMPEYQNLLAEIQRKIEAP